MSEVAGDAGAVLTKTDPVVLLVGNANVGKSTLFNSLTGARQHAVNAPGTTVHLARGRWKLNDDTSALLVDLPGTTSLLPRSPDEQVVLDALTASDAEAPDLVIVVLDASTPARGLYLLAQVAERGVPVVVALTMGDVAERHGVVINTGMLADRLGVPVVAVDARSRGRAESLATAVSAALEAPADGRARIAVSWIDADELRALQSADRPLAEVIETETTLAEARFAWQHEVLDEVITSVEARRSWTDRLDRVAIHPVAGPLIFLAAMWGVFIATTRLAAPMQELFDSFVTGPLTSVVDTVLTWVGLETTWVRGLLVDGLLAGVGTLLTFIPVLAVMYVLLAVMEDSGYLARAAVVADKAMRPLGLDGRALLPLLVGFGCNVPAFAATRALPNARQRILVSLMTPYVTCTARLTVYILLASIFFGSNAGTVVFAMYCASVTLVIGMGLAIRWTVMRDVVRQPLVLQLPPYHAPAPRTVALRTWTQVRGFLREAAGIITITTMVVWVLAAIPVTGSGTFGNTPVQDSAYGRMASTIAPVFAPAGFDSPEVAGSLITGFVAKEVVVASLAQSYALAEPDDVAAPGSLGEAIRADLDQTSGGHGPAAALALMMFVLAYTACMSAVAAQAREIGWKLTNINIVLQLVVAWVLAVGTFSIARIWL